MPFSPVDERPLWAVERMWVEWLAMSAYDPKRTSAERHSEYTPFADHKNDDGT